MEREKEEDIDRQQEERERGSASSRFLILRGKREQNRAGGGSAQQQLSITLYSSPARRSRSVGRPVVIGGVISSLDITFALAPARPLDLRNVIGSKVGNKIRTSSRLPPQMPLSEAFQEIYAFPKKGRSNECT